MTTSDPPAGVAIVEIPLSLRSLVGGAARLEVAGATVKEVIDRLVAERPELRRWLLTPGGQIRSSVHLFLNEEDIRNLSRESTPVRPGDVLAIVPAIAGGAPKRRISANRSRRARAAPRAGLTAEQLERYSRHLLLPEVGLDGQRRLLDARVLVIGTGGLGSPCATYLAAAGVGEIGLVDFDRVERSNLQRQLLFSTSDVGRPKVEAARDRLEGINPDVIIRTYAVRLTSKNARSILAPYDVVIDGTDNFATRYLVNDACVLWEKPNVYGSIYRFEGQVSLFDARRGPCYRCLYPEPPPPDAVPSCAEAGVLGVLPGIVGTLQAAEALKVILGRGRPLYGRLLLFDALALEFREFRLRKNPNCVLCGPRATQRRLIDYPAFCGETPTPRSDEPEAIDPVRLSAWLRSEDPPLLIDVREPTEWAINHLPGARLIPGSRIEERLQELAAHRSVVLYCKTGGRSREAAARLQRWGVRRVRHLKGGIDAWCREVDPAMPRY